MRLTISNPHEEELCPESRNPSLAAPVFGILRAIYYQQPAPVAAGPDTVAVRMTGGDLRLFYGWRVGRYVFVASGEAHWMIADAKMNEWLLYCDECQLEAAMRTLAQYEPSPDVKLTVRRMLAVARCHQIMLEGDATMNLLAVDSPGVHARNNPEPKCGPPPMDGMFWWHGWLDRIKSARLDLPVPQRADATARQPTAEESEEAEFAYRSEQNQIVHGTEDATHSPLSRATYAVSTNSNRHRGQ